MVGKNSKGSFDENIGGEQSFDENTVGNAFNRCSG
jgi:hypothetical protein